MGRLRAVCPRPAPSHAWAAGLHLKSQQVAAWSLLGFQAHSRACGSRLVASLLPASLSGWWCYRLPGAESLSSSANGLSDLCRPPSHVWTDSGVRTALEGPRPPAQPQLRGRPMASLLQLCDSLLSGLRRQADPQFSLGPKGIPSAGRGCTWPLALRAQPVGPPPPGPALGRGPLGVQGPHAL